MFPTEIDESLGQDLKFEVYPNPYTATTNITFTLEERSHVSLEVFNVLGKKIQTLVDAEQDFGKYQYSFSAKDLGYSSGIYFLKFTVYLVGGNDRIGTSGKIYTRKLIEY